jgi:tetratricopeptide (TPR) repeat protein/S1-C subfamily serine protease
VLGIDPDYDLALLRFQTKKMYSVAQTSGLETLPPEGEPIAAAGFPARSPGLTIASGELELIPDRSLTEGYRLGYSAKVEQGMSGGPILNAAGQVIGVNGMGANPVVSSIQIRGADGTSEALAVYDFMGGGQPSPELEAQFRSLSWGVPLSALSQALPELWAALNPVEVPNGMVLGSAELTGIAGEMNATAAAVTVRLEVAGAEKSSLAGQGSGVIVARQGRTYYILTAEHVVRSSTQNPRTYCEWGCRVVMPDGTVLKRRARHVTTIPGADLAIVKVSTGQDYAVATLSRQSVVTDDELGLLMVSGFVGDRRMVSGGWPQSLGLINSKGNDSELAQASGRELVYSAASYQGLSGGPILDRSGRLVGIHSATDVNTMNPSIILGYSLGIPLRDRGSSLVLAGIPSEALRWDGDALPPLTPEQNRAIRTSGLFDLTVPATDSGFEAWMNYGQQLWRVGRYNESIAAFTTAIRLESDNGFAYYGLGTALSGAKRYGEATRAFQQATLRQADFIEAWLEWGLALYSLGQKQDAIEIFSLAIERDAKRNGGVTQNYRLLFERASILWDLEQYKAALADYSTLLKLNPDNSYAYNNRGLTYYNLKQYEAALADYGKAIALNPDYAKAYNNRGLTYSNLKQYEAALADYGKAIALNPDYAKAYYNRGLTYSNLKQYEAALADYGKAIALNPDYATAYYGRGITYYNLKQYEAALADYGKAIALNPDYANAYISRGITYRNLKQYEAALADYGKAIALNPDLAEAYGNRGFVYEALRQYSKALEEHQKSADLFCAQGSPNCAKARQQVQRLTQ